MFASLPTVENQIDQHLALGQYNEALANIVAGVHNHYQLPGVENHFLYYPRFDQQIVRVANALTASNPQKTHRPLTENTLIVASMMHQVGGHSHVIADVAREVSSPTIILTDMLWFFHKSQEQNYWLHDAFPHATVISLNQLSLWAKCLALNLLTQRLQPKNILYFNHHQDPIPFVGTLGHEGSKKTLIHHCDHHPSLGNTIPGVHHVDFVKEMATTCASSLDRETLVLPLYVPDQGMKAFAGIEGNKISAVTSGAYVKYARTGPVALQYIAETVLRSLDGQFFHIGAIDPDWIQEVKQYLASIGIDPQRFVALGGVKSVWQTLLHLDAHIYIGSAPTGGGRAATEAQGCGYPLVYHRISDQGVALGSSSLYANQDLGWSTQAELAALLKSIGPHHQTLSKTSRSFYEQYCSQAQFKRVLDSICA